MEATTHNSVCLGQKSSCKSSNTPVNIQRVSMDLVTSLFIATQLKLVYTSLRRGDSDMARASPTPGRAPRTEVPQHFSALQLQRLNRAAMASAKEIKSWSETVTI